jgi:hypothetical protein
MSTRIKELVKMEPIDRITLGLKQMVTGGKLSSNLSKIKEMMCKITKMTKMIINLLFSTQIMKTIIKLNNHNRIMKFNDNSHQTTSMKQSQIIKNLFRIRIKINRNQIMPLKEFHGKVTIIALKEFQDRVVNSLQVRLLFHRQQPIRMELQQHQLILERERKLL